MFDPYDIPDFFKNSICTIGTDNSFVGILPVVNILAYKNKLSKYIKNSGNITIGELIQDLGVSYLECKKFLTIINIKTYDLYYDHLHIFEEDIYNLFVIVENIPPISLYLSESRQIMYRKPLMIYEHKNLFAFILQIYRQDEYPLETHFYNPNFNYKKTYPGYNLTADEHKNIISNLDPYFTIDEKHNSFIEFMLSINNKTIEFIGNKKGRFRKLIDAITKTS
jgi:hypothetical protein